MAVAGRVAAVACRVAGVAGRVAPLRRTDACDRSALLQLRRGVLRLPQVVLLGTCTVLIDARTSIMAYDGQWLALVQNFFA